MLRQQQKEELRPPKAALSQIKENGDVTLDFDREMRIVPDIDMITNGKIKSQNNEIMPIFSVDIVALSETQDRENLGFSWTIIQMTTRSLQMKVVFENARAISM